MTPRHRAFTLIELLVVIAIIGVLIGVLVPVLASARDAAIGSSCLSNQRQLMVAVTAYSVDDQGRIPYGPEEFGGGVSSGADDFYIINGMITSLISDKFGRVVGAGLMLDHYLSETPEILFCPGADQDVVAQDQLDMVGTGSAISGYLYRHGSNTSDDFDDHQDYGTPLDGRIRLDNLGLNGSGEDIRALFADNNFIVTNSFYDLFHRSNHGRSFANIAYADGHAEQRNNQDSRYEVNIIGTNLFDAIDLMVGVFEEADLPE